MNTEELSNRLTQILTGITTGEPNPNIIQGFVQNFIEDFKPDYYYEISVTDVEGYILLPLSNTMPGTKTRTVLYLV